MRLSEVLWNENLDVAHRCLSHPFVRGIADGSLSPEKFRAYVSQDAFFLGAFARAYAVAAARSPDATALESFSDLLRGTLDELRLHAGYADGMGIDLDAVSPMPSTLAYTDFLLATAWGSGLAETMAAMAPCMRLYAWLATEIAEDGVPEHDYSEWIRTYSAEDFAGLADLLDGLLDRHGEDTGAVRSAFARAMRLELAFFEAFR